MTTHGDLLRCLDAKHSVGIIMALGSAQRDRRTAIISDIMKHSENGQRTRQTRLHELIDLGVVAIPQEWKHPHNQKPLILTPLGWNIYTALNRCLVLSEVIA